MSYTKSIKNELVVLEPTARCCKIAEIAGLINTVGAMANESTLKFKTENWAVARKFFTLLKKTFNINVENSYIKKTKFNKNSQYELTIKNTEEIATLISATGTAVDNVFCRHISSIVMKKACCKRSYIRGAFLAGGSVTAPDKGYHLEISLKSMENANELINLLVAFEIMGKTLKRASGVAVYLKDSAKIADFLNLTGAVNALFDYENTKVIKEVRNGVNRLVNCDTANIKKTVTAAQKQIRAIEIIEETRGLSSLPENLAQTARARREFPELKLEELGTMLGVGKSGINHRLRKIEAIANEINARE